VTEHEVVKAYRQGGNAADVLTIRQIQYYHSRYLILSKNSLFYICQEMF